ncbi:MAG: dihydroorotase [Pseudomonadota bacterium]
MEITITRPDDWHLHLRDGDKLQRTVNDAAQRFHRAIVMPNLNPPVITCDMANKYRERILAYLPSGYHFKPLMPLYLTDNTPLEEVRKAASIEHIPGFKLYPSGATTNSDAGVTAIAKCYDKFALMEEVGLVLLIHGEATHKSIDVFDREKAFIDNTLEKIVKQFPRLRVVFEHITTADAVDFVRSNQQMGATITPQHLLFNRNAILVGGIKPHYYCLPVLKRETHRLALVEAATSGNRQFFLGTDSAPHAVGDKENACGCAGIYSSHIGIEIYAEIFDKANALDQLEAFASFNGPDFYQLPRNQTQITLIKQPHKVPATLDFGQRKVSPLYADSEVQWRLL